MLEIKRKEKLHPLVCCHADGAGCRLAGALAAPPANGRQLRLLHRGGRPGHRRRPHDRPAHGRRAGGLERAEDQAQQLRGHGQQQQHDGGRDSGLVQIVSYT